jgi:hypothetical protein
MATINANLDLTIGNLTLNKRFDLLSLHRKILRVEHTKIEGNLKARILPEWTTNRIKKQ